MEALRMQGHMPNRSEMARGTKLFCNNRRAKKDMQSSSIIYMI